MPTVCLEAFIAMNGINLSPYFRSVTPSLNNDLLDANTFVSSGAKTYKSSLWDMSVDAEGYFNASEEAAENTQGLFNTAAKNTSSDYPMLIGLRGATVGYEALILNLKEATANSDETVGGLVMNTLTGQASEGSNGGTSELGAFIFNATATSATNGVAYDNSAGDTGYIAQIHNLAGDNAVDVMIQHSVDNSVWVDLLGAPVTLSVSAAVQISSDSASVNRYVRAQVTPGDTTNTVVVAIKVGFDG